MKYFSRIFAGLCGVTTALMTLKLIGFITWSWWWVLAPLYIPVGGAVLFLGVILLTVVLTEDFD